MIPTPTAPNAFFSRNLSEIENFEKFRKKIKMAEGVQATAALRFELEKKYMLDLEAVGLSSDDPSILFKKIKHLILEKIEENPMTKQQIIFECFDWTRNQKPIAFCSRQNKILRGSNLDEIHKKMTNKIVYCFKMMNKSKLMFESGQKIILKITPLENFAA